MCCVTRLETLPQFLYSYYFTALYYSITLLLYFCTAPLYYLLPCDHTTDFQTNTLLLLTLRP